MRVFSACLIFFGLLLSGCLQETASNDDLTLNGVNEQENISQNYSAIAYEDNITSTLPELEIKERSGFVILDEISSQNVSVFTSPSKGGFMSDNGSFTINVSSKEIQVVVLVGENYNLFAGAISLPEDDTELIIGAESTAVMSLWNKSVVTQKDAEQELLLIKGLSCYGDVLDFFKTELPNKDLNSIITTKEYLLLTSDCKKEKTTNPT